jgi:hypothetical protein
MALGGNKGIDVQGGFDSRNFQPFVEVDMERNTPMQWMKIKLLVSD